MEQVLQRHVQTHVQEEQNIVLQENQHVVMYQVDIIQLDVIHLETNVQDKVNVQPEHIVQVVFNQIVQEEQNIVLQENQHVVTYQVDTIQLDVIHPEINVQDKVNVPQEIIVQVVYHLHAVQENIVLQDQQVVLT